MHLSKFDILALFTLVAPATADLPPIDAIANLFAQKPHDFCTDTYARTGIRPPIPSPPSPFFLDGIVGTNVLHLHNNSTQPFCLVCWWAAFPHLGARPRDPLAAPQNPAPAFAAPFAPGWKATYSVAPGADGSCAAVYADTRLTAAGSIAAPALELGAKAYGVRSGVISVSRERNMSGPGEVSVHTASGCVSDMETCVFPCREGVESCTQRFGLRNCGGPGSLVSGDRLFGGCAMSRWAKVAFGYREG